MDEKQQLSLFAAEPATPPAVRPAPVPVPAAPVPSAGGGGNGGNGNGNGRRKAPARLTAEEMGAQQREISVTEFFTKNRHLLGFDNPSKALLTTVKEAVDNSLDAAEEAGILPDIRVDIQPLAEQAERLGTNGKAAENGDPNAPQRFVVTVTDNGPGVIRTQVPKVFGKLLYGSKFHRLRQSRGQQGIGISAAGMYGQLTTGYATEIISRPGKGKPAHRFEIFINTQKNAPDILSDEVVEWPNESGVAIRITLEARYQRGGHSVEEYLRNCAVANPHARFVYRSPEGEETVFERATAELPVQPREIKPHPYGVELGMLIKMLKSTHATKLRAFLSSDFSRVSPALASEICDKAGISQNAWVSRIGREDADRLYQAIPKVKLRRPPTDCLAPIGETAIEAGLRKEFPADFFAAVTREPSVYRGNPFLVEAGLAYGGTLPGDEPVRVIRFANRVPLLYQQSACAVTKAVVQAPWRNYGVQQSKESLPVGPLVVFVHFASVWVPFTSESKEAVAHYPEILKELRLALQECGRKLGLHISRRRREADAEKKKSYIEMYLPHVSLALKEILGLSEPQEKQTFEKLVRILERSRKP